MSKFPEELIPKIFFLLHLIRRFDAFVMQIVNHDFTTKNLDEYAWERFALPEAEKEMNRYGLFLCRPRHLLNL